MKPVYKFRIRTKSDKGRYVDYVWGDSPEKARSNWFASLGKHAPESLPMVIDYAPMTVHDLRYMVENWGTETHFFSRGNMKFAGDTMANYGVRSQPVLVETIHGPTLAWELYRKRPVKYGLQKSAFFCVETLCQVFEKV